ncbi:hypothetical protein CDAR_277751 [Caerostris darwini]|uniref:Uncharacterized protein n=1 Tax=Caerostris darwini TaxID=1538125 RepID=A0AAV4V8B1_9ARAC|nr:hypothetical protein CDAR_277751 [Caerostris darwini]
MQDVVFLYGGGMYLSGRTYRDKDKRRHTGSYCSSVGCCNWLSTTFISQAHNCFHIARLMQKFLKETTAQKKWPARFPTLIPLNISGTLLGGVLLASNFLPKS